MDTISSIFLGIVQGATEFLPISSSGHLVLFQNLLGFKEPELLLDSSLHLGTLLAICLYFRTDLKYMVRESLGFTIDLCHRKRSVTSIGEQPHAFLAWWVIIGTLPTLVIGLVFRSFLENLFGSVTVVGIMLVITGLILAITRLIPKNYNTREKVGLFIALAVGTAQGISLVPGISRSGATIVCGILCGLERESAARFSFLISIPAIVGAVVLQLTAEGLETVELMPLISGFICSALVGLIALKILMGMVRKGNLYYFAPYCWALGLFILLM